MSTPIPDFSPRWVGDTSHPLLCSFIDHEGNVDVITGASTMTMHFRNRSSGVVTQGQGTFSNINGTAGTAVYNWAPSDVALAGFYDFAVSATLLDGLAHWDAQVIEFRAVF